MVVCGQPRSPRTQGHRQSCSRRAVPSPRRGPLFFASQFDVMNHTRSGSGIREVVERDPPFEFRKKCRTIGPRMNWLLRHLGRTVSQLRCRGGPPLGQQRSPFCARPDLELLEGRHDCCTRDIRMSIDPDHPCSMQSIPGALRCHISGSWVALPPFRETQL